jgi:phage anti-repressor protein
MEEKLNIANLIEKNSITRLSKDYENRFLNKIKGNFTDNQQQLFVASFYCFLKYDTKKDFVIDFDNVWKWLGFTRKDNAKRLLEKFFTKDIDYKIISLRSEENKNKEETRGRKEEQIMLTINTFKKFCLKSETKKADEVHDYYIKLEELLQETVNEESNELRLQLNYKEAEIQEKEAKIEELYTQNKSLSKYVVRKFNSKYKSGNCVYLISSTEIKDKFKVGSTSNINDRISDLSTGSPYYFEVLELYYTEFHTLLEKTIKEVFGKYRISVNCEWFDLEVIDEMKEFIKSIIKIYDDFKCNSSIDVVNELENNKLSISDNDKLCINCNEILGLKNFFSIDKKNKIFEDKCIVCYEKENGESKQCSKCSKIKKKIDFVVDRTKKDGLTYECKECRYEQNNKKKEEIKIANPNLGKIQCISCENFKDTKMFYKTKLEDGNYEYSKQCKECYCEEHGKSKQCFTCKEIKIATEFDKKTANADGLESYCKSCRKIERDAKRAEKKAKEDPNKDKKQCKKCNEYHKNNMYFKKLNEVGEIVSYYDECIKCYNPSSLQCNRCNDIKKIECFSKDSTKNTGYHTLCKECKKKKS